MIPQTDVAFRGMERSEFVEQEVKDHVERLTRSGVKLVSCRVLLEAPSRHHAHGIPFHIRIEMHMPGELVVIDRDPGRDDESHTDAHVALADAFHCARRKLEERARRQREEERRANGANGAVPTVGTSIIEDA
jgi:hypothetical protein